MSAVRDTVRVCPRCGAPAETDDYCAGCGTHLATLPELPTKTEWQAQRVAATAGLGDVGTTTSATPVGKGPSIKPLLHPTERSRLILAVAVAGAALAIAILGVVAAAVKHPLILVSVLGSLTALITALWFGEQVHRARLLGGYVKVNSEAFPELQALLDEVAGMLQYHRRVDVFVVDKGVRPIDVGSYLGTRNIVIEGGLVAELLTPQQRSQLIFLFGRSIGALKAKHARLDLVVFLLGAINALKFVSPLLRPWYRATTYSGDQIGMVCCSDVEAALRATRRLLVGKELAAELDASAFLPQACLVQRRLLPRFAQLLSSEPHNINRYANLLCFARYHDPESWERLRGPMSTEQSQALDQLWERSPYRRRLTSLAR